MMKGSRVVDNVSYEEWVGGLRSAWQLIINMAGKKKPLQKRRQQSAVHHCDEISGMDNLEIRIFIPKAGFTQAWTSCHYLIDGGRRPINLQEDPSRLLFLRLCAVNNGDRWEFAAGGLFLPLGTFLVT